MLPLFIFLKVDLLTRKQNIVILRPRGIMKTSEKQILKKNLKRLGLFMLIVLLPICVVCVLLIPVLPMWQNVMVLVVMMLVLFLFYSWLWQKIDRRTEERLKKKKDPFSD